MDAGTLFFFAVASLALWIAAALATFLLNRVALRRLPVHGGAGSASAPASFRDAFGDRGEGAWLVGMAAIIAASFLLTATDFSLLFTFLFGVAVFFYFAFFEVRSHWTARLKAVDALGPPTRRTLAWASSFAVLTLLMEAAWIAMLACLGAGFARLIGF